MEAIEGFVRRARELGAEHLRVAGTSALRDAADGAEFVSRVSQATGIGFEILSGIEEARIGFTGATSELPDGSYVVCDIGGGSTELTVGDERPRESVSVDVGSVRVTESCLHTDPPTEDEIADARSMIEQAVDSSGFDRSVSGRETFVGIGGTVQTVAALVLELGAYDFDAVNLSTSRSEDVAKITQRLLSIKVEEIRKIKVIDAGRTDVIAAGSLILLVLLERWGVYRGARLGSRHAPRLGARSGSTDSLTRAGNYEQPAASRRNQSGGIAWLRISTSRTRSPSSRVAMSASGRPSAARCSRPDARS